MKLFFPHRQKLLYPHNIVLIALLLQISTSCSSTDDSQMYDEMEELEEEEDTQAETASNFPKSYTAIEIKRMSMLNTMPKDTDFSNCLKTIDDASESISGVKAFSEETKKVLVLVDAEPKLYHWCFFKKLADLDYQLDNFEMAQTYDRTEYKYNQTMKGMWVLSVALDIVNNTDDYYRFLRQVYVRQVAYYFNRDLKRYSEPLYADEKARLKKNRRAEEYEGSSGIIKREIRLNDDKEFDVEPDL